MARGANQYSSGSNTKLLVGAIIGGLIGSTAIWWLNSSNKRTHITIPKSIRDTARKIKEDYDLDNQYGFLKNLSSNSGRRRRAHATARRR